MHFLTLVFQRFFFLFKVNFTNEKNMNAPVTKDTNKKNMNAPSQRMGIRVIQIVFRLAGILVNDGT